MMDIFTGGEGVRWEFDGFDSLGWIGLDNVPNMYRVQMVC